MGVASLQPQQLKQFSYTLEIRVEGRSGGEALEKIVRLLNTKDILGYNILHAKEESSDIVTPLFEIRKRLRAERSRQKAADPNKPAASPPASDGAQRLDFVIADYIRRGTLVRMSILKPNGKKMDMPCRLLHFDEDLGHVSVYHVDEKKVYTFGLNEIEDLIVS